MKIYIFLQCMTFLVWISIAILWYCHILIKKYPSFSLCKTKFLMILGWHIIHTCPWHVWDSPCNTVFYQLHLTLAFFSFVFVSSVPLSSSFNFICLSLLSFFSVYSQVSAVMCVCVCVSVCHRVYELSDWHSVM